MGRGKKPFKKRTKVEQKRTSVGLYRHITEVLNHANKLAKEATPPNPKRKDDTE